SSDLATYSYRPRAPAQAGTPPPATAASATPQAADTTAPAGSLTINAGAAYTSSTSVTLALAATDTVGVTGYYLATSATPPAASAAGWTTVPSTINYAGSLSYTLSAGDGTKTFYTWYKDAAGNVSTIAAASILLDQTAPSNGTVTATAGSSQVTVNWSGFTDA